MKEKVITKMAKCDYDKVKEELRIQLRANQRPDTSIKFKNSLMSDSLSVIESKK